MKDDLFYRPKDELSYSDISGVIENLYPDSEIKTSDLGIYVHFDYLKIYFQIYILPDSDLRAIEEEAPEYWKQEKPSEIFCITYNKAHYEKVKPILKKIMENWGGYFSHYFDELFDEDSIDEFDPATGRKK